MSDGMHVAGVVDARDARINDAVLVALASASPTDVRTGVLAGPGSLTLVKPTAAQAPMTVTIDPHHWFTSRGAANGPYRGANETTRTVNIAAAPASNSRIDVVYVKMQDATAGVPSPDGISGELYGVVTGAVAVSPLKPALPIGAEELATVTVAAGATATNGAGVTIANTARQTALRGAPLPVANPAERTALSDAGAVWPGMLVHERSTGRDYTWAQTGGWRYTGGNPPPTTLITVNTGWGSPADRRPQSYLDASGLVHIEGIWTNNGSFTPNATQYPLTLPVGMRPAQSKIWIIPLNAPGSGPGSVLCTVLTDGRIRIDSLVSGPNPLPANSGFFLDGAAPFHPGTTGTAALA